VVLLRIYYENHYNADKVAIVLGEENLLVPLLYSLPSSVGALNITMGYQVKTILPKF
jgi:hypothetical protein